MSLENCCTSDPSVPTAPTECPRCGGSGRTVDRITVKALLRPVALMRLTATEHRFCPTADCPVVYFGPGEVFKRGDLTVPVFQKEPPGNRLVCYCFGVSEGDLHRELGETGRSTVSDHITALVRADRCACEVKNPQGSCCLGNLATATSAARAGIRRRERRPGASSSTHGRRRSTRE